MKTFIFSILFFVTILNSCAQNFFWSYSSGNPEFSLISLTPDLVNCMMSARVSISSDRGNAITERGIVWNGSSNPTTSNYKVTSGSGVGVFILNTNMSAQPPSTSIYVRAYVITSKGTFYSNELNFSLSLNITVSDVTVNSYTHNTAFLSGNVTLNGNSLNYAILSYGTTSPPNTSAGNIELDGTGNWTFQLSGLSPSTTYYVRSAVGQCGINYQSSNIVSFTTSAPPGANVAPTVNTLSYDNVTTSGFKVYGNVYSDGGASVTERGVVIRLGATPTTSTYTQKITSGTGVGTFDATFSSLTENSNYNAIAYAINSVGTSYGQEFIITTNQSLTLPTVSTDAISNISVTGACGGGNVTNAGNTAVTARGLVWGLTANPTISSYVGISSNGTGTGTFTYCPSSLMAGTTYHVRAYATNTAGTSYGSDVSFVTSNYVSHAVVTVITNNTSYSGNYSRYPKISWRDQSTSPARKLFVSYDSPSWENANLTLNAPANGDSIYIDMDANSIAEAGITEFDTLQGHSMRYLITETLIPAGSVPTILAQSTKIKKIKKYTTSNFSGNRMWRGRIKLPLNINTQNFIYILYDYASTPVNTVPILATPNTTALGSTTATVPMVLLSNGGATVTSSGVCYNIYGNPTTADATTLVSSGYTYLNNLIPNTTYFYKNYAVNSVGTGYGEQNSFTTTNNCPAVGDTYQGGIVAYIYQNGDPGYIAGQCHGIIIASADLSPAPWGCSGWTFTPEPVSTLGYGSTNTYTIANRGCQSVSDAAKLCYDYVSGVYTDWWLPSLDELQKVYNNRASLGTFASDYYWTSTTNGTSWAKAISFATGTVSTIDRTTTDKVRPIRYF